MPRRLREVDVVIVGADAVAANGDVVNKIGTYGLAILACHHGLPFYVAVPRSTFDPSLPTGRDVPIEQRDPAEVSAVAAEVEDTARRVAVVQDTLLPQAEAAYGSVLGQYAVGEAGVAQALLAQRDLLDLAVDRVAAEAGHQRAWARLHALVGGAP